MNCKPGDLALVIHSMDQGKMVQCIELLRIPLPEAGATQFAPGLGPVWKVDRPMQWRSHNGPRYLTCMMLDKFLMPIRPEPDESTIEKSVTSNS